MWGREEKGKREKEKPGGGARERRNMNDVIFGRDRFLLEILNPEMPKHRPMPNFFFFFNLTDSALSCGSQQISR